MNNSFDVIIIGAGPAGSLAAYDLCKKGVKVLILEKVKMPRYKICGGGVQSKIFDLLPFNISCDTQKPINKLSFTHNLKNEFMRYADRPLMYCFMRDELDNYLLHKAVEACCHLVDEIDVKNISEDKKVTVTTNKDVYYSDYLIGADGLHSVTARALKLEAYDYSSLAIEGELFPGNETYEIHSDVVRIDWGTVNGGYAWVFPKNDHLSIGAGALFPGARHLRQYFDSFLKAKNFNKKDLISIRASALPHRISQKKIYSARSVLIGDAAGLVDPFSGEGINNAIRSALIAGKIIFEMLESGQNKISRYQEEIDNKLLQENITGHEMRIIFNFIPKICHNLLKSNDKVWNAMEKIFIGEKNYLDVKNKFGKLWTPSVIVSQYLKLKGNIRLN